MLLSIVFFAGCSSKKKIEIFDEKSKYGVLEDNNDVIIKPIYDEMSNFDARENKNSKTDHPNILNFHWLHNYYGDDYAIVEYKSKYGVVNKKNEMVVKPIYDSITKLFNGYSIIKLDDKYGYMNNNFEVVQKPIFKYAREFYGNVTFVQSNANSKWGCITKDMNLIINDEYDEVYNLYNGFARIVKDGKWGFINDKCEVLIKPTYEYAYDFSNEYAEVRNNGKVLYVDEKGNELTAEIYKKMGKM